MGGFILTMIIAVLPAGSGASNTITSFTAEYNSIAACNAAKDANRESLRNGTIILSTCTQK
jgi:hypothetical protein